MCSGKCDLIILFKKAEDEVILKVHDAHTCHDDSELFLVTTNLHRIKWIKRDSLTGLEHITFINERNQEKYPDDESCNTRKSSPCLIKCKTRGILLGVSNCGIVMSFRELFGNESLTQVASFYLDTLELYTGKYSYIKHLIL